MYKSIVFIAILIASQISYGQQAVPETVTTADGQKLKLVWHDEFNGKGLPNPADWTYEHGFVRNGEKQFYTVKREKNAYQKDGKLIIESIKENYKEKGKSASYTSASVTTQGLHSWTYGRIEVAAKLPKGRGTWPAIWMLGDNISQIGWPKCGEIDIMEYVGFNPTQVHATVHAANTKGHQSKGSHIRLPGVEDKMAVYAVEWTEDKMTFFVDDKMYMTAKRSDFSPEAWPFDKPFYLILNTAIGGQWGGQKGIDDSIFPTRFEIDYVRVYQADSKQKDNASSQDSGEQVLFDGSLNNWSKVTLYDFSESGPLEVKHGAIRMNKGNPAAGIKYNGQVPRINYELSYQARRVDGNDFFGLAVLPYKDKSFGFVLGGWGGNICGFSCLDGYSADENDSTFDYNFKNNVWYDVKLVITDKQLDVYINGEKQTSVSMDGRTVSDRIEMAPVEPFGFASWYSTAELKNIKIKKL